MSEDSKWHKILRRTKNAHSCWLMVKLFKPKQNINPLCICWVFRNQYFVLHYVYLLFVRSRRSSCVETYRAALHVLKVGTLSPSSLHHSDHAFNDRQRKWEELLLERGWGNVQVQFFLLSNVVTRTTWPVGSEMLLSIIISWFK